MTTYRLVPVEPSEEMIDELAKRLVRLINADPSSWGIYKIATRRFYKYVLASAPVPQNELLEAAKEARKAQKEYMLNDTYKNRLMMRTCEEALDAAIRNAEQGGGNNSMTGFAQREQPASLHKSQSRAHSEIEPDD